ncbi:MAG: hypothetical protein MJE12_23030 [Alphaproteobacteria bacterium]|nr:hypothetical protein [Alphaproteobacteria bacterium]
MHLIDDLRKQLEQEQSLFRTQLLREDIARLERLCDLARRHADFATFAKEGAFIGWTQGDFRTHELREQLDALLKAFHDHAHGNGAGNRDAALRDAWRAFDRSRMAKLVGCL